MADSKSPHTARTGTTTTAKREGEGYSRKKFQWTFSPQELIGKTPSHYDGIKFEEELVQRAKGVNFVFQAGQLLNFDNALMVHAAIFLHRFYLRFSIKRFHSYDIAGTSLFLSSKIEEQLRRLRDVAIACTKTASKNPKLVVDEQSKDFWRWSDIVIFDEEVLLEALGFDVTFNFYDGLSELEQRFRPTPEVSSEIRRFLVDISRLAVVLVYKWPDLVLTAFRYAVEHGRSGVDPAKSLQNYQDWTHFLLENGRKDLCDRILYDIGRFYRPVKKYMAGNYQFPVVDLYEGIDQSSISVISRSKPQQKDTEAEKQHGETHKVNNKVNGNGKRSLEELGDAGEQPSKRLDTEA